MRQKFIPQLAKILDRLLHLCKVWLVLVMQARHIAAHNDGLDELLPEEEELMKQWLRGGHQISGPGRLYTL